MQLQWDYSKLASAYVKRPPYAPSAIQTILSTASATGPIRKICDIGAGAAHLTLELSKLTSPIVALEPNDEMRKIGQERTKHLAQISWAKATAEETCQADQDFDLVTFGSSFNVTNRPQALMESHRILRPLGWFVCLWNHRDLEDPIQGIIEKIIAEHIPGYDYGSRREDQTAIIRQCGLFKGPLYFEGNYLHTMSVTDAVEAWRSHGTLERQAKDKFPTIVSRIEHFLRQQGNLISVPYKTRVWMAQKLWN